VLLPASEGIGFTTSKKERERNSKLVSKSDALKMNDTKLIE